MISMGKNQDILESIAKNASDLETKMTSESTQSTLMTKENLKTSVEIVHLHDPCNMRTELKTKEFSSISSRMHECIS